MTMPLLLASASPRRRELLERVGMAFEVRAPDIDESVLAGEAPSAYVARIARTKVAAVTRKPGQWALAADTTVTIDGAILGKAESPAEATAMLERLVGRTHQVLTGYAIVGERERDGQAVAGEGIVSTDVDFVAADARLVADYVASNEWRGKAGAYAIQGIGCALVRGVRGSVTNVIGLPIVEVLAALRELGGPVADLARGVSQ